MRLSLDRLQLRAVSSVIRVYSKTVSDTFRKRFTLQPTLLHFVLLLSRQYLTSMHIKRIEEMMICLEGIFIQIY